MTRTKLASVGFVAERNCMRQQVLDSAKSLPNCGRSGPQRHATLPTHEIIHTVLQTTTTYYKVLRSTTPYYKLLPKATPYYKALLQYYKVLQSTAPVLFRTTLYYKVLLQYYSVLQSTTPYYPVLQSTTPVLRILYRAPAIYPNFTMVALARNVTLQHQMLRLPRKVMIQRR